MNIIDKDSKRVIRYVPSILVYNDDSKEIINILDKSGIKDKYKDVNLKIKGIENLKESIEEIQRIRQKYKENFDFLLPPLCNLIFILPKKGEIKFDEIEKVEEKFKQSIRKIFIVDEDNFEDTLKNKGTCFLFSKLTDKNELLDEIDIRHKIVEFLIILLSSELYEYQKEYYKIFFEGNDNFSLGIETSIYNVQYIFSYLKIRTTNEILKFILREKQKELKEDVKDWLNEKCSTKIICDLNKIIVVPEKFDPELPFFSTREWRERKIKDEYYKNALETIENYLKEKKEKGVTCRTELEEEIFKKLNINIEKEFLEFLGKKIETLKDIESIIEEIIKENGILDDLEKSRKKKIKWGTLRGYNSLDFNIKSPHPNWLIMGILFIIFLIPNFVKVMFFPKISNYFYLKWLITFSLPLIIYSIYSKISLLSQKNKMLKERFEKIKLINDFFEKAFISLPYFFEYSYILKLKKQFKDFLLNFLNWLNELEKEKVETDNELKNFKFPQGDLKIENYINFDEILKSYINNNTLTYIEDLSNNFLEKEFKNIIKEMKKKEDINNIRKKLIENLEIGKISVLKGTKGSEEIPERYVFCENPEEIKPHLTKSPIQLVVIKTDYTDFLGIIKMVRIK